MAIDHRNTSDHDDEQTVRVTIELTKDVHCRLMVMKYGPKYRGEITLEQLVIEALRKAYPEEHAGSDLKII